MLDHIETAAERLRESVMRHAHVDAHYGYLTIDGREGGSPFTSHPLDPTGAGGKLALFVVEALCLILRSQTRMQEQLNRLNSVIDTIGARLSNITTDLADLLSHLQSAQAGDSEVDVGMAADRVQAILDRLGTIDQAIVNANDPAAQSLPGAAVSAPATDTGTATGEAPATGEETPAPDATATE